ncbi:MAG TPA: methyltransferase domain-containing protein [Solirubrobacteraceae bacterium]|nr:methyltransferase domain-containing protein [Solirubrobacteraceae bacterium]
MAELRRRAARRLGAEVRGRLRTHLLGAPPAVGQVRFGQLRRLTPVSRSFGFDRGQPVDRYYIEAFLRRHAGAAGYGMGDIAGSVLEVGGDEYARRFGGWGGDARSAVRSLDILHADASNPLATIVGDLATGESLASERFDCVICTETLHVIYDVQAAVRTLHRVLKPGGVALVTVAGITQTCRPDRDLWGDYWRFTTLSARRLFESAFPAEDVRVEAFGNVLASVAFLHGLAAEELRPEELDARDPDYEMLIAIRAVRRP